MLYRAPAREYGWDATMFHFSANGEIENGEIRFQAKATDRITWVDRQRSVACRVQEEDLNYWRAEPYPFVLVLYDAPRERGYWLHIQDYIRREHIVPEGDTITLRIPTANKLTLRAVDRFRRLSLDHLANLA